MTNQARKNPEAINHIRTLLEKCCSEIFESLNCKSCLSPSSGSASRSSIAETIPNIGGETQKIHLTRIDACSEDLKLVMQARIPNSILRATHPMPEQISTLEDEMLDDWSLELSNRLLGRLKTQLSTRNGQLTLGLPQNHKASAAHDSCFEYAERISLRYDFNQAVFELDLAVKIFNDDLAFEQEIGETDGVDEGELEMF